MLTPLLALGLVNPLRVTDGAIPAIVLITGSRYRIFGTHHLPKTWPDGYGIPEPMVPSLLGQFAQPFPERAPSFAAETAAPAPNLGLARTAAPSDGT